MADVSKNDFDLFGLLFFTQQMETLTELIQNNYRLEFVWYYHFFLKNAVAKKNYKSSGNNLEFLVSQELSVLRNEVFYREP